jgi:hypothetical protein
MAVPVSQVIIKHHEINSGQACLIYLRMGMFSVNFIYGNWHDYDWYRKKLASKN